MGYQVGDTTRRREKENPTGEYWGTWVLTKVIKTDNGELLYEYTKVSDEVRNLPELTCCACRHSGPTDICSGMCDLNGVPTLVTRKLATYLHIESSMNVSKGK